MEKDNETGETMNTKELIATALTLIKGDLPLSKVCQNLNMSTSVFFPFMDSLVDAHYLRRIGSSYQITKSGRGYIRWKESLDRKIRSVI